MSDAIRLTVVEDTPISLAVGEADPVARREIAELQEDVAALQEDVTDIEERLDDAVQPDGYFPTLASGAALSLTSPTAAESTWVRRVTDAVDGVAVVEGILGQTVVWNQIVPDVSAYKSGTATSNAWLQTANFAMTSGHKYLLIRSGEYPSSSNTCRVVSTASPTVIYGMTPNVPDKQGILFDCMDTRDTYYVQAWVVSGETYEFYLNLFDLTAMFGAGNEPSTVAEFEALYPEPYYPYDAGSLLSVQMEGIETVGFNQWDEVWESGGINSTTGANTTDSNRIRAKNLIPVFPSTTYYIKAPANATGYWYGADKEYLGLGVSALGRNATFVTPAGAYYMRFTLGASTSPVTTYNHDICINLSWSGYRNGEYEPYWKSERTIPAATYFPNGMRSVGTVHDELTSDAAIVRVGAVDLGTLLWAVHDADTHTFHCSQVLKPAGQTNIACAQYTVVSSYNNLQDMQISGRNTNARIYVRNDSCDTVEQITSAMSGVMLYYELATPTTTPIDPPLNLTYRVEQSGTESVMHTDPTAAPTWRTRYPFDLAATVMANIAPVEQPVATATHAIGDLLCVGWQLYRATRAIAIGERITQGTNVTATTVAAEIAAIQ